MKQIWAFIRHNSGVCIGTLLCFAMLFYAYSCQSMVISLVNPQLRITRSQLVAEVEAVLVAAETKFEDLDRQDLVKDTIFNSVFDLAQGKAINPIGIALSLAGVLGVGAIGDNIRKRTHINTLKGDTLDGKVKEKLKEILQPTKN